MDWLMDGSLVCQMADSLASSKAECWVDKKVGMLVLQMVDHWVDYWVSSLVVYLACSMACHLVYLTADNLENWLAGHLDKLRVGDSAFPMVAKLASSVVDS